MGQNWNKLYSNEIKEVTYNCNICNDEMMVLATEEDISNGIQTLEKWDWRSKRDLRYKFCRCKLEIDFRYMMKISGLSHLINLKIDDFQTKYLWQKTIKDKLISFVKTPRKSFFLSGQSGSGKTMAMSILFKNLIGKYGIQGKYLEWESFITESNNNFREIDNTIYEELKRVPILYIDDFLKSPNNDIDKIGYNEMRYARNIINQRYKNQNLITLISTELTEQQLEMLDQSLHGRIVEMATSEYFLLINNDKKNNIRVEKAQGKF